MSTEGLTVEYDLLPRMTQIVCGNEFQIKKLENLLKFAYTMGYNARMNGTIEKSAYIMADKREQCLENFCRL